MYLRLTGNEWRSDVVTCVIRFEDCSSPKQSEIINPIRFSISENFSDKPPLT